MAELPYMPLYVADIDADTGHLSEAEFGVYMRLLMAMWRRPDGAIEADDDRVARYVRVTPARWKKHKSALAEFLDYETFPGKITQKRLQKERAKRVRISETNANNAASGGHAKSLKSRKSGGANGTAKPQPNHERNVRENVPILYSKLELESGLTPTQSPQPAPVDIQGRPPVRDNAGKVTIAFAKWAVDGPMRDMAGACLNQTAPTLYQVSDLIAWLDGGADFDLDILPAIEGKARSLKPNSTFSWGFFAQAVANAKARRTATLPEPTDAWDAGGVERVKSLDELLAERQKLTGS